jgi:hypothetical protein
MVAKGFRYVIIEGTGQNFAAQKIEQLRRCSAAPVQIVF